MATVVFMPPTDEDIAHVACNLRPMDEVEAYLASGTDNLEALRFAVRMSTHAWAAIIDGEPACLFGVAPFSVVSGHGCPWLLGTEHLSRNSRVLLRCAPRVVRYMLSVYPKLSNLVLADYHESIRWLEWLGFEIGHPEPVGSHGVLFRRFEMNTGGDRVLH